MSIVERMKATTKGLTQPEVAKMLGEKNASRLNSIYSNKQKVPEDFLVRFVEVFKVDANWLLLGDGQPPVSDLSSKEKVVLANYRACGDEEKQIIERTCARFAVSEALVQMITEGEIPPVALQAIKNRGKG